MLAAYVAGFTTALSIAGLFYYIAALWAARGFALERMAGSEAAPAVSILKPVKGADPEMYEAFRSHCRQQYAGAYELIFAVSSLEDPAVPCIERLKAEFPGAQIELVLCPEVLGPNGKVSNLVQALPHARHAHILVSDSDIRVGPRYLARIMSGFHPGVGMVTAPYRGRAHGTVWSKLEALGIATDFFPGVLMSRMVERGVRFGLGSTLAFTREALEASGGLEPLTQFLGDDYELGARIARAGYRVVLSHEVVETAVPAYTLRGYLAHQMRWARNVRDARKAGYAGLVVTFGLPWALANVIASGLSLSSVALLVLMLLARLALAVGVGVGILGDRQVARDLWLVPLRDCLALFVWTASFAGNIVEWRGERFRLKNGRLTRMKS